MQYIGVFALVYAAFSVWRGYSSYLDTELLWCRAFLRAIKDYRERMRCFLSSPADWALTYEDEHLFECGFLSSLRDGSDFCSAYRVAADKIFLPDEVDGILSALFDRLGDGYLEGELEAVSAVIERLCEEDARLSADVTRKRKAVGAMLGAFTLGIVILII